MKNLRRNRDKVATSFSPRMEYTMAREVDTMTYYLDLALLLNFAVDLLLIIAANRLTGYPVRGLPTLCAAGLGAVYGAVCFLPGMTFLSGELWCFLVMIGMCTVAFGVNRSTLRRGALFILLNLSVGGLCLLVQAGRVGDICLAATGVCAASMLISRGNNPAAQYVTVMLRRGDRVRTIVALRDTGNTLKDPVTGNSVLIAGADVARDLLGLTPAQLRDPICTVVSGVIPGGRLMPYRSVGNPNGMLLGVRLDEVRIDSAPANVLVAFAPEQIGSREGYQALTGGVVS